MNKSSRDMGPARWKWLEMDPARLKEAGIETPEELLERFYPVGQTFHHETGRDPYLWHIVGYMDDVNSTTGSRVLVVVYKRWSKRYKQWMYASSSLDDFLDQQIDIAGYDSKYSRKQPVRGHLDEIEDMFRRCQELINKKDE